jgi:hypothetical protein
VISTSLVNASPLILLTQAGHLDLLATGGFEVRVPEAMIAEVEVHGSWNRAAAAVRATTWLRVVRTALIPDRVAGMPTNPGDDDQRSGTPPRAMISWSAARMPSTLSR